MSVSFGIQLYGIRYARTAGTQMCGVRAWAPAAGTARQRQHHGATAAGAKSGRSASSSACDSKGGSLGRFRLRWLLSDITPLGDRIGTPALKTWHEKNETENS